MFEKLVRFCRTNGDKKKSGASDLPDFTVPTITLTDALGEDETLKMPEPSLEIPDGEATDPEKETTASAPIFRIARGSASEGDDDPASLAAHSSAGETAPGADTSEESEVDAGRRKLPVKNNLPVALGGRALESYRASDETLQSVFATYANPRLWRNSERSLSYVGEVTKLNREVFTPTRPKRSVREFVGRADFIEGIVQAIEEERAHVVLFGHKSVGKTSVLNIISDSAGEAGYLVARVMCTADLTFETLVRAIFEDLSAHLAKAPAGPVLEKQLGVEQLEELVEGDVSDVPAALRVFGRITGQQIIILLDDFHRIGDNSIKTKIRDFMGALSDRGAWVSLVLAGHGDLSSTFEFLQGDIPSGTVTFELELMSPEEVAEIVERGGARLGIRFDEEVTGAIIQLSQGLPVVTQWLGLLTARRALRAYADSVTMEDLIEVTDEVSSKVSQRLTGLLNKVQGSGRTVWAEDLLFLAARTPIRKDGMFSASDMKHEARRAVGRSFSELNLHRVMAQFCNGDDDPILEKIPTADGMRYRFNNPMMRAIIMLRNARRLGAAHGGILGGVPELGVLPSPETV
jgi:hypothetical protein